MNRLSCLALLLVSASSFAARYEVRFDPRSQTAEISVSVAEPAKLAFVMPSWIPGDYEIFNYGQNVTALQFKNGGRDVAATKDGRNRWVASAECDRVVYRVRPSRGNFSDNLAFRGPVTFLAGGAYGWIEGHDWEPQTMQVFPGQGQEVFSAMPPVEGSKTLFKADNYEDLIDCPIVVGQGFKVLDGKIRIVAWGEVPTDLTGFQALGQRVAAESAKMMPGSIGDQYTFFLDFGGGGGGLEHRTSTRIGLWSANPSAARGIMFHEFFHAYNVRRIRPESIWKFDFTKAPVIESLWWLEGVTDYYADVLAVRTGDQTRASFLRSVGQNAVRERSRSATNRVSALESSKRVFEVAGSQGYGGLSYYSKGWLIGAVLDLSIRGESGGKYSLDNVMSDLWKNYLAGRGYPESMIRALCVKYGGEATGKIYDEAVTKAQPVPISDVLAKAGLRFEASALVDAEDASATAKEVAKSYPSLLSSK